MAVKKEGDPGTGELRRLLRSTLQIVSEKVRSFRRRSMGWRLTRLVGLMLLGIVALGISLAFTQYRTSRNAVYAQVKRDTVTVANSAQQTLVSRIQTLSMLSATRSVRTKDRAGMKSLFDEVVRGDAAPGLIGWLDSSDQLTVSSDRALNDPPIAAADRSYVQQVRSTKQPFVSEGLRSQTDDAPVFVVAVPTTNELGIATGTLIWATRLDQLDSELSKIIDKDTLILDRLGKVLFGPADRLLASPHPGFDAAAFRRIGSGVAIDTTSLSGESHHIVGYAVASAGDWLIVRDVSVSDGLRGARKVFGLQLLILGLVAGALLWFGLRTQRELSRSAAQQSLASARSEALRVLATDLTPATSQVDVRRVLMDRGAESVGALIVNVAATDGYRTPVVGHDIPMFTSSAVPKQVSEEWTLLPMQVPTPMRDAYLSSLPVVLSSIKEVGLHYPELVAVSEHTRVEASSSYPLFNSQHQTVGVIGFAWDHPQSFDQFQLAMLDTVSRLAGQALERAALYDREQSARLRAEQLQQFTFDLVVAASVNEVSRIIVESGVKIFGATRATLSAQEVGKNSLSLCGSHGYDDHAVPPWATALVTDKAPTLDALLQQKQLLVNDLANGDYAHHTPSLGTLGSSTWLAVPLPVEEFDPTVLVLEFTDAIVRQPNADNFATRAALGLDRQRRVEIGNRAVKRAAQLSEAVAAFATAETGPHIGASFARAIAPLQASGGLLGVLNQSGQQFELVQASVGANQLTLNPAIRPNGMQRVILQATTGQTEFVSSSQSGLSIGLRDVHPALTEEVARSIQSWCFLPLMTADRPLGFAVLLFSEPQSFDDEQRIELTSYAALCAIALARAQRFEREHEVAVILQASLLPQIPTSIGTTELAGRYRPSTRNVSVGGDWFDVITLDNDRLLLVVGDVVGHGIHSAAAMGKLSTATKALAAFFPEPFELLQQLDKFAASDVDTRYASIALVLLDPTGAKISTSIAGHPAPLAWGTTSGIYEIVAGRGPSLGVSGAQRTQHETLLHEPTTIVMYTDGLTERRSDHIDGRVEMLRASISRREHSMGGLADRILSSMLEPNHSDDVALLVVNVNITPPAFERPVKKDLSELRGFRQDLRTWLERIGSPDDPTSDMLIAIGEALTNAIEHGNQSNQSPLIFKAERVNNVCVFTVQDEGGSLVDPNSQVREQELLPSSYRGRGLVLMRRLMDHVTIDSENGTTMVTLTKALPQRMES